MEGDAFKLYSRFLVEEGSGVVGIFLTCILYFVLISLSIFMVYYYLLNIHMNGRMLDVYRRIHNHENDFFVPRDFEVTMSYVKRLCEKASRWTGTKGTQRKVSVCDYVLHDPLDPKFEERTTHIVIYELGLDGTRQLYRHFLRNTDGSTVEVFGDMATTFGSQYTALGDLLVDQKCDA